MSSDNSPSTDSPVPSPGRYGTDLFAAAVLLAATVVAVALDLPTSIRALFAVVLVFAVPGYVLSVALFPRGDSTLEAASWRERTDGGISLLDRLVLTVGLSVCVVVLLGILLEVSPASLSETSRLAALVAVTVAAIPIASYRRRTVPAETRFTPLSGAGRGRGTTGTLDVLTVVLALSVLFAGGAVAYSVETAGEDAGVTEFYFESESGESFPTEFTVDEDRTVALGLENREDETTDYTVVGELQRVEDTGDELVVRESERVSMASVTLSDRETTTLTSTVTPREPGTYRLTFMVYRGDAPDDPSVESAYREVHVWITVSEPAE